MKLNIAVTAFTFAILASFASEASAQTTLYACYVKNSGTVYRIKTPGAPDKCAGNATEFSWNQEGQVGPQGPEGPAGPSGWPGVVLRSATVTIYPSAFHGGSTVQCLPGQVLLSGGYEFLNNATSYQVVVSRPASEIINGQVITGWTLSFRNTAAAGGVSATVYAYCRDVIS